MPQIHSEKIKKEVKAERLKGKTYRELKEIFGISKSTLSYWFGDKLVYPFDRAGQLKHLASIRPMALLVKKKNLDKRDLELRLKVAKDMQACPVNNIGVRKLFIAGLYWAEGSKHARVGGLKFANTDPRLCKIFITLLRRCYPLDEIKFKIRLHLHYYHRIRESKKFWSELLGVPLSRFGKIYIKKRSKTKKFRKNFMGICFIYYGNGAIRRELLEIGKQFSELVI
jgi:hypothetical protein